jgi:hypothetical protein
MMQITEMNEAMGRFAVRQTQPANFDPLRFNPASIANNRTRRQQQCGQNKPASVDFVEFHSGTGVTLKRPSRVAGIAPGLRQR